MAQRIAELLQACLASWLLKSKTLLKQTGSTVVTSFLQSSFPAPSRNTNREDMLQRLQTCISAIGVLRHSGCTANTIALLDVGRWRSGLSFAEQAADVVEALVSTTKRGEYGVHNAYFPASAAHGKIGKRAFLTDGISPQMESRRRHQKLMINIVGFFLPI